MTVVTGYTAAHMQEIIDSTVASGHVTSDHLILVLNDGSTIDAGNVRGVQGIPGAGYIICTSSTRPASPAEGTPIYETDTKLVRVWNGTRWRCQERFVCTSSTRPTLVSGDEGVQIYETDTDRQYIWTGSAWVNNSPPIICTSTTRPSGPSDGQQILETDTGRIYVRTGSAWIYLVGGAQPLYSARMTFAGTFTAPNGVETRVPFDGKTYDYNTDVTLGASAGYTAPVTGLYAVSGSLIFGYNNSPRQLGSLLLRVGSAERKRESNTWGSGLTTSDACSLSLSDELALNVNDVVSLRFNGSGSSSNGVQVTDAFMNIRKI